MFNQFVRFVNRSGCQSFGRMVAPAERHIVKDLDFTDLFLKPERQRRAKPKGKPIQPKIQEQIDRIRPIDYMTQKIQRKVYVENERGEVELEYRIQNGKKVLTGRKDFVNCWTRDDDAMVDTIVERLLNGEHSAPTSLPSLAELFRPQLLEIEGEIEMGRSGAGSLGYQDRRELPE